MASFLHEVYLAPNVRSLARQEIVARLEDTLYLLRESFGPGAFPKEAAEYLDDWASDDRGWLRKYYPLDSDEPHYDLTPATEKALEWLAGLEEQRFIGTSSRLLTVFDLLRQMAEGSETDPEARVRELERKRSEIEAEMARIREGKMELMDDTALRERFIQVEMTARALLADFRAVEQNFRSLDRDVRERIATWEGAKGALLQEFFGERDAIADSDQGKSFRAFWDFLMSASRQEELTTLLERVFSLEAVRTLRPDRRLLRIHYDWLEAGEGAQRTVARLSEQLRRFLDEAAWLENRRIMELVRHVEQEAIRIRRDPPSGTVMTLAETAPEIALPFERPLYRPATRSQVPSSLVLAGTEDLSADLLFAHSTVDRSRLEGRILRALLARSPLSLGEIVARHPLEHGLAELVVYLAIASDRSRTVVDEEREETIGWTDGEGVERRATLVRVLLFRE